MLKAILLAVIEIIAWMGGFLAFVITFLSFSLYLFDLGDLLIAPAIALTLCIAFITAIREMKKETKA